jgi:5-methylcytosine-specific restriction endonuclease McrA
MADDHTGRSGDTGHLTRLPHAVELRSKDVLSVPVLVLNRFFAPVTVASARRALVLLYCGSARALDDSGDAHDFVGWRRLPVRHADDRVSLVDGELRVPRVLHLLRYERFPSHQVRLTRKNLLLRDEYQCQYCGRRPGVRELNLDHVIPRSRGGRDSWDNLVVSCRPCNLKTGRRTPQEASMKLLRTPHEPRWSTTRHIQLLIQRPYEQWRPFLQAG